MFAGGGACASVPATIMPFLDEPICPVPQADSACPQQIESGLLQK